MSKAESSDSSSDTDSSSDMSISTSGSACISTEGKSPSAVLQNVLPVPQAQAGCLRGQPAGEPLHYADSDHHIGGVGAHRSTQRIP